MPRTTKIHPDQGVLPIDLSIPSLPRRIEPSQNEWIEGARAYDLDQRLWDIHFLWEFPKGEVVWARTKADAIGVLAWKGTRYREADAKRWRPDRPLPVSALRWSSRNGRRRPEEFRPWTVAHARRRRTVKK